MPVPYRFNVSSARNGMCNVFMPNMLADTESVRLGWNIDFFRCVLLLDVSFPGPMTLYSFVSAGTLRSEPSLWDTWINCPRGQLFSLFGK